MKVLVLGATGRTGRLVLAELARAGHAATALVRSEARARGLAARLVPGDARDPAALARAAAGQDAVICTLGTGVSPFREVTLLSAATRALVDAMRAAGVPRLVCVTGLGAGDSAGHGGFVLDRLIMPLLLRRVYADKDRQEAVVRGSGLDWVLVRPGVLDDRPATGRPRALEDLSGFRGGTVARGDVAGFVVAQLSGDAWLRRSPVLAR